MRKLLALVVLACWQASVPGANYDATDANGVRVFSTVPPVGVHPRVILSPEDLPAWRKQVAHTYRGKEFFAKRFESKKVIDALAALDTTMPEKELVNAFPHKGPGTNHDLLYATMDVMFHQDEAQAKKVCRAVANFARVVLARSKHEPAWGKIEENIGGIQGNTGIRTGLGELWCRGGADFALAYDFLYNEMTPEQRSICRLALSVATKDLVCWGMHFPRGRGISNWYGYHGELGPMLLAIEGEEGFRPRQWEVFRKMIRDWAEVHIYAEGGSNEDGYTINTSLREGQFTLIAMARRGENYFAQPGIRNYFKWLVLSLVPGETGGDTVGYSSCRAAPYESAPVLARWAMPGDKLVNYYFSRYKGANYQLQKRWQYGSWSTLLGMNYEESSRLPLEMKKLGLPTTHVFPLQGLFITRSDWTDRAAYLNVLARHDAWYDRHENVDRGRFVFAANGRRWAIDRPWGTAQRSEDHSLVHIDGKAQLEAKVSGARGKAPHARLVQHGDFDASGKRVDATTIAAAFSYAALDLSNAYNWLWAHSWDKPGDGWEPETRTFEELGWKWKRPGQPERLYGCDNRDVPKYNFLGCNFWRKPYNTVEKAYRIAGLVRGHHPYAIIVDEIKKDEDQHVYEWFMPIPDDVEQKTVRENEVVLGEVGEQQSSGAPVRGSRRLLVRFVGQQKVDVKVAPYSLGKDRRTGEPIVVKRLVGAIRGVEPEFKALLIPFLVGEDLPRTRLAANTLEVGWTDQLDTFRFTPRVAAPSKIDMRQKLSKRITSELPMVIAFPEKQQITTDSKPVVRVDLGKPQHEAVAHYSFDERSGRPIENRSGKGAAVYSRDTRVRGRLGNAVEFDGKRDHVVLPRGIGTSVRGSIAFWMKSDAPTENMAMLFCASSHAGSAGNGGTNEVAVFLSNRGQICLGVANVKLNGPILTDGDWHHVAATWDKEVKLYVDGSAVGSSRRTGPSFTWTGHATLGKPGGDQRHFAGAIDDFYIFNRAISRDEVRGLSKQD